jgi:hypothetical protein
MYLRVPYWVADTCRSRAVTSISAEWPSGKAPTTLVRRRPCVELLPAVDGLFGDTQLSGNVRYRCAQFVLLDGSKNLLDLATLSLNDKRLPARSNLAKKSHSHQLGLLGAPQYLRLAFKWFMDCGGSHLEIDLLWSHKRFRLWQGIIDPTVNFSARVARWGYVRFA